MDFEVGMKVVWTDGRNQESLSEVVSVTPKGFIRIKGADALFKSSGEERGGTPWWSHSIRPATESDMEKLRRDRTIRKAILERIKKVKWSDFSTEQLQLIDEIIGG